MKILLISIFLIFTINAKEFDFNLKAVKIAKDTYMFEGKEEYFSIQNGGDISNTYFIIAKDSIFDANTSIWRGFKICFFGSFKITITIKPLGLFFEQQKLASIEFQV
ncbi:MAG: hypothetical protein HRT42_10655 [Campylobacteraceae bacterium]|nr:hypothetical protein [Campylobacteraceae bacterium]